MRSKKSNVIEKTRKFSINVPDSPLKDVQYHMNNSHYVRHTYDYLMQTYGTCSPSRSLIWLTRLDEDGQVSVVKMGNLYYILHDLRNCTRRFYSVLIHLDREISAHANILLVDKQNKTVERYEPHHTNDTSNFNTEALDDILETYFAEFYQYTYVRPLDYCLVIPSLQTKFTVKEYHSGLCMLFSLMYLEYRLKFPDLNRGRLLQELHDKLANLKQQNMLPTYLRNFADRIHENIDERPHYWNTQWDFEYDVNLDKFTHLIYDFHDNLIFKRFDPSRFLEQRSKR